MSGGRRGRAARTALALALVLVLAACGGENSKIEGRVLDAMTGKPLAGVKVRAGTVVHVKEDEGYANRVAETGSDGRFQVTGLSPRYDYTLLFDGRGYLAHTVDAIPPKENKTLVLSGDVRLFSYPPSALAVFHDGAWEPVSEERFTTLQVAECHLSGPLATNYLDLYLPTATGAAKAVRNELKTDYYIATTDPVRGEIQAPGGALPQAPNILRLPADSVLAVSEEYAGNWSLNPLLWFPAVEMYDRTGNNQHRYDLPEGFHFGYSAFQGRAGMHSLDCLFTLNEPLPRQEMLMGRSPGFVFLRLTHLRLARGGLYAFCPCGVYDAHDAIRYQKNLGPVLRNQDSGLPVFVFQVI